jgi:sugar O-acyltransferase (sialic acid O-acetyltransferase NeuD family)
MAPRLVIWGAGQHALVVAEIVRLRGEHELVGWLDDVNLDRHGSTYAGLPILGGREQLDRLHDQGVDDIAFAVGRCEARLKLAELASGYGYRLPTLIHPRASVGTGVPVGEGTVLKAGAIVDVGTTVGANVMLAHSSVAHGSVLEDGVLIAGGGSLAGGVCIGRGTFLGIGVTVADRIRVGRGCLIGAGAVVVHDIPDGFVAYGSPARAARRVTVAEGP